MLRLALASLALALSTGAASATTVLADFDGGSTSNTGTVAGGMTVAAIGAGSGACAPFSGSSGSALCGSDINGSTASPATLTFSAINFDKARLSFDLGAAIAKPGGAPGGDFDDNAPGNVDFIRVSGAGDTLAEFKANPDNDQQLISVAGAEVPAGQVLTSSFTTVSVTTADLGLGTGNLVFEFFTTNASEHVAIDNVSVEVVPLPAGLPLLIAGLGAMALAARRRRA